MGLLDSIADAAKGAVHAVEDGVSKAVGEVEHAAAAAEHAVEEGVHHVADAAKAVEGVVEKDVKAAAHAVESGVKRVGNQVRRGAKAVQHGAEAVAHQVQAAEHAVADEVKREAGEVVETVQTVRDGIAHTVQSAEKEAGKALRQGKKALGDHLVAAGEAVRNAHSLDDVAHGLAHEAEGFGGDLVQATEDAAGAVVHTAGDEAEHLVQVEAKHLRDDAGAVMGGIGSVAHTVVQDAQDGAAFAGEVGRTVRRDMDDLREAEHEAIRTVGHQVEETELGKRLADSRLGEELKMAYGTKETARKAADSLVEDPTGKLEALQEKGGSIDLGDSFNAKVGKDLKAGTLGVTGQFGDKINVTLEKGKDGQPDTYTVTTSEGVALGVYGSAEKDGFGVGAETSGGITAGNKYVFHSQEEAVKAIKLLEREQMSHQREVAGAASDGNPLLSAMGVHSPTGDLFASQAGNIALTREEEAELERAHTERTTTLGTKSSVSMDTPEFETPWGPTKVSGKVETSKSIQSKTSLEAGAKTGTQEFSVSDGLTVSKKVALDPTELLKEASGFGGGHGAHPSAGGGGHAGEGHAMGGDAGAAEASLSVSQSQDVFSFGHTTAVSYEVDAARAKKGMANPLGDTSVLGEQPSSVTDDFTAEVRDGDTLYGGHAQVRHDLDRNGGPTKSSVKFDADVYDVEGGTTSVEAEAKVAGVGQVAVGYDHDDLAKKKLGHWESDAIPVSMPSLEELGKGVKGLGKPLKVPDEAMDDWMHRFGGVHPHAQ